MKIYFFGLSLYLLIGTSVAFAQSPAVLNSAKLTVSKSFESTDDKTEPAIASLTIPSGEPTSFLINAGIGYQFNHIVIRADGVYSTFNSFTPFIVGNYNNLISDKQRNYKIGGNFSHFVGKVNVLTDGSGGITGRNSFTFNHTVEYVRDIEEPTHSLVYTVYLSQNRIKRDGFFINEYHGESRWQTFVGYNIGIEYQQRFQSDDPSMKGFSFRNYHNVLLRLALRAPDKKIKTAYVPFTELAISYIGRYEIARSTDHKEGYLPLFKTEFTIYPTQQDNFSVGFSYNAGSDPLNGLKNQHYYLLALKFKVN